MEYHPSTRPTEALENATLLILNRSNDFIWRKNVEAEITLIRGFIHDGQQRLTTATNESDRQHIKALIGKLEIARDSLADQLAEHIPAPKKQRIPVALIGAFCLLAAILMAGAFLLAISLAPAGLHQPQAPTLAQPTRAPPQHLENQPQQINLSQAEMDRVKIAAAKAFPGDDLEYGFLGYGVSIRVNKSRAINQMGVGRFEINMMNAVPAIFAAAPIDNLVLVLGGNIRDQYGNDKYADAIIAVISKTLNSKINWSQISLDQLIALLKSNADGSKIILHPLIERMI